MDEEDIKTNLTRKFPNKLKEEILRDLTDVNVVHNNVNIF